jgi:predicted nucleic acid-binding protein
MRSNRAPNGRLRYEHPPLLESAIEGRAEFVVSGDKDLLCLGTFRGIRIVRASEFLGLLANPP